MSVPLLSVIGPVEPALLEAFVAHYRKLGVKKFLLAFHFPEDVPANDRLLDTAKELGVESKRVSFGPSHEEVNPKLYARLREEAGKGWHMIADSDEFHVYPEPVSKLIAQAEEEGTPVVEGLLFDRFAQGDFPSLFVAQKLDSDYPLGGFLTHYVLGGEPTKVVLAQSGYELAPGNHEIKGHHGANLPLIPVHHFKWRHDVVSRMQDRVGCILSGYWHMNDDWVLNETLRALHHISSHGNRIGLVEGQELVLPKAGVVPCVPVSLDCALPPGWETASLAVAQTWWDWPSGAVASSALIPTLAQLPSLDDFGLWKKPGGTAPSALSIPPGWQPRSSHRQLRPHRR
ncbi:MAG: hypothetical protein DLM55_10305 [Acidimicrobiales bacterium]|nr:MAG: hypothetical protein DLM55_10305 [Acidimicrobiales bacterium]